MAIGRTIHSFRLGATQETTAAQAQVNPRFHRDSIYFNLKGARPLPLGRDGGAGALGNINMNSAQQRAQEIRRRYRFTRPRDIERVLKAENIQVVRFPLKGRVQEMIVYNFIGLPLTLERDARAKYELLAHALGHYLLHAGNQPFFHLAKDRVVARQWEHQAWDFAYELLIPADTIARLLRENWSPADLCEYFEVTEEFFQKRMQVFREENTRGDPWAHSDMETL